MTQFKKKFSALLLLLSLFSASDAFCAIENDQFARDAQRVPSTSCCRKKLNCSSYAHYYSTGITVLVDAQALLFNIAGINNGAVTAASFLNGTQFTMQVGGTYDILYGFNVTNFGDSFNLGEVELTVNGVLIVPGTIRIDEDTDNGYLDTGLILNLNVGDTVSAIFRNFDTDPTDNVTIGGTNGVSTYIKFVKINELQ